MSTVTAPTESAVGRVQPGERADLGFVCGDRAVTTSGKAGRHALAGLEPLVVAEPPHLGDKPLDRAHGRLGGPVGSGRVCDRPRSHDQRLPAGQGRPQLLGDERGQRVQEPQQGVEHVSEHQPGPLRRLADPVTGAQRRLGELDVPVAELVPGEPEQRLGRLRELVALVVGVHLRHRGVQPGQDPPVRIRQRLLPRQFPYLGAVEQREPGGIPQLVAEVPGRLDPVHADRNIDARVRPPGQGEPHGVGAVGVHPLQRIDCVAAGLAHLLAVRVPDQPVEGEVLEGDGLLGPASVGVGHRVEAEHHHPGDPEEDDVVAGDHDAGRVEPAQVLGVVRPAQRRERPQGRREPGVENVGILCPAVAGRRFLAGADAHHLTVRAVPDRDPVAPPELPADAPVVHVVDPLEVAGLHGLRVDGDATVAHGITGRLGQWRHPDEPLRRQPRLDDRVATRAVADGMDVRSPLGDDPALFAQGSHDRGAGLEAVQSLEGAGRGNDAAAVHDRQVRQTVPLPDLEVVRIVGRGDLDRAGAERGVDVRIGHDRDAPAGQRQLDLDTDQVAVTVVVGMDGDPGVAEHCLGPGRHHDDRRLTAAVPDRDQLTVVIAVLDLDVRQRGHAPWAPVDDPLGAVDQSVVVEPPEDRLDGPGEPVVHGEPFAGPVDALAEAAHLAEDLAAVLLFPLPDPGDELVAA